MKRLSILLALITLRVTAASICAQGHGGYQYHPEPGSALSPSGTAGLAQASIPPVPTNISPGCCVVLCSRTVTKTRVVPQQVAVTVNIPQPQYFQKEVTHPEKVVTTTVVDSLTPRKQNYQQGCRIYERTVYGRERTTTTVTRPTVGTHVERDVRMVNTPTTVTGTAQVRVPYTTTECYWREVPCCDVVWRPCYDGCCSGWWDVPAPPTVTPAPPAIPAPPASPTPAPPPARSLKLAEYR